MKKTALGLALLLILLSFPSCGKKQTCTSTFYLMDTVITVTLYTADENAAGTVFAGSRQLLSELDALWARQKEGSEPDRFNRSEELSGLDSRTVSLLSRALAVSDATGGAFDVTVAPLVDLWQNAGERNLLPTDEELSAALALTGYKKLVLTGDTLRKTVTGVRIDLGGIGKGAAISLLIDYLKTTEIPGGLVSFGSNVAVFGQKPDGEPFRVALRNPRNETGSVGTFLMKDGEVLSVSGDYERYVTVDGERYHHILNTATGYPAQSGLASVAVLCADGATADALSTALFVMGAEKTLKFYRESGEVFEAVLISTDDEITDTGGLDGRFLRT